MKTLPASSSGRGSFWGPGTEEHRRAPRARFQEDLTAPLPSETDLVLVTDLDGTLLEGSLPTRRRLYSWLASQRHRVLQVFSTGRDLPSVARLLAKEAALGLHPPHLVIGDVGCTVACGASLTPTPLALAPIEALWHGRAERVLPLLAGLPGLSAKPLSTDRRLAYGIDPRRLDRSRLPTIEAHGVDCLVSGDKYLDVLPAGVNKGSTLLGLLEWLELEPALVVTAGDSLNDLAMFETGLQSVMVGNAEPGLVRALPGLSRTYRAGGHGCEGLLEGLRHFGFGHLLDGLV
ncbi:HAD family hydrolase [Synechococcus sp. BA-132 BA5]|uniref:HAD family hydrolase n=1 Tax=Synechococcus sp. BA-132 BA5 TaxID=3110252 RepID=UPI002B2148D4|nr:HAD family hydrolase [Synechococcus sp. BA-132 BA5]MEA5415817.1 HAD family hydrolase [Synechococcus sp. BA-132 BA5]